MHHQLTTYFTVRTLSLGMASIQPLHARARNLLLICCYCSSAFSAKIRNEKLTRLTNCILSFSQLAYCIPSISQLTGMTGIRHPHAKIRNGKLTRRCPHGTQFTCFTGTKVQILTLQPSRAALTVTLRTSSQVLSFLAYFPSTKSTNTDIAGAAEERCG